MGTFRVRNSYHEAKRILGRILNVALYKFPPPFVLQHFSRFRGRRRAFKDVFWRSDTDDEVVVEDDDDEDEEDDEKPQLTKRGRGRISQRNERQLRVQPIRRRKPPACDTSSHRRH
ncbi:hypothetical protein Lal_00011314 [Lupinus albus]|nr:hypothetical protein Lal_00011314 [Lupinus albus]